MPNAGLLAQDVLACHQPLTLDTRTGIATCDGCGLNGDPEGHKPWSAAKLAGLDDNAARAFVRRHRPLMRQLLDSGVITERYVTQCQ